MEELALSVIISYPGLVFCLIRVHPCSFVANIFNTLGIVSHFSC